MDCDSNRGSVNEEGKEIADENATGLQIICQPIKESPIARLANK